ncbi:MAG: Xaa-Pro peptidase family protein [Nitrososphaerales archaeon]|nr:Xaa-Pro peptidase family protein [Nitrososphaerales archaeon]
MAREIGKAGLRGVIIVPGPNLRYLTGVESLLMERPFMLLVPADGTPTLIAPRLEAGPYRNSPLDLRVHDWTDSQGPASAIGRAVKDLGVGGKWGVEGRVPFLFLHRLLKRADPHLEDAEPILQGVREVKDEAEVRTMKKAARILSDSFRRFPALIRQGISESELARKVSDTIYAQGGTKVDDVLVQSGPHAADPHSLPTSRKIARGESIVIDIGATFEGYYADITRTFCLGQSREVERVYDEVRAAEEKAISAAGVGVAVGKVDAAARRHLEKAGLGNYFIHRTGHGLGLEVHEAPYIVQGGREVLGKNMFFTVEPGAYIPGKLGVRIEDNVMIEAKRASEITDPPKEYGWWR